MAILEHKSPHLLLITHPSLPHRFASSLIIYLLVSVTGLLGCEGEVSYRSRELSVDLNTCLDLLKFDEEGGCGSHWQASREGCVVIQNHLEQTYTLAVRFEPDGMVPINGERDLTGDLSFNAERGGALSFYLFGQPHQMTPDRCDSLEIDSICEGDCRLAMINQPLALSDQGRGLNFVADRCIWRSSEPDISEVICDQVDNDCDGVIDESLDDEIPSVGSECEIGVGACSSSGTYQCVDGVGQPPSCDAAPGAQSDERCDQIDNDCDGSTDENFNLGDSCIGLKGICQTPGVIDCVFAEDVASEPTLRLGEAFCRVSDPSAAQRSIQRERGVECNGEDDDCDGFDDEHFTPSLEECGEGNCAEQALTQCVDGMLKSLCRDGVPMGNDQDCDGQDDDCDGRADESYLPENEDAYCGVGACKVSGLFICTPDGPELICTPNQGTGDDDDCDGIDDDCDGRVDEGYQAPEVTCGIGNCVNQGDLLCVQGSLEDNCTPLDPSLDHQCDGEDNDCDGRVDEGYVPETTRCGQGVCAATGRSLCINGQLIDTCTPSAPLNQTDLCDGFDYDCDGQLDEDHEVAPTSCGRGSCARSGELVCVLGQVSDTCTLGQPTAGDFDAACDLIDSDCDGRVDEGYVGASVSCGDGACSTEGVRVCINGDDTNDNCVPQAASADSDPTCDGIDEDCDRSFDEDYPSTATTCGQGYCSSVGVRTCENGQVVDSCVEGQPLDGDAICDGIDSDCDGRIDEGYIVSATSCGQGVCARQGLLTCISGAPMDTCVAAQSNTDDAQCDGLDNDCDGSVDESYPVTMTECGLGVCRQTGQLVCINGREEDTCNPLQSNLADDRCDNADQDCDGRVDEGYTPSPIICGVGACRRSGQRECQGGDEVDVCTPGQPAPIDQTCNQVDNDCDGRFDEDYEPVEVPCGDEACNDTGFEICTNNGLESTCVPNAANDDTTCNGVDDDCDDRFDEDYQPPTENNVISCGIGACQNTNGRLECIAGSVTIICNELPSTGVDDDCDGVDDDCDGSVDELYSMPVTCGQGECQVTSEIICVNQTPTSQCAPNLPTSNFDICGENKDNNCDGQIQQYDVGDACSLGQGICQDSGQLICNNTNNGVECDAQPQMSLPESCNNLDDDCDGVVDNNLGVQGCLAVGVFGVCSNGTQVCVGGNTSCQPGEPATETQCNGADEDCDSYVDEEVVGQAPDQEIRRLGENCDEDPQCLWQCDLQSGALACINSQTQEACD